MRKKNNHKFKFDASFLITIITICLFSFMTVGYAAYNQIIDFTGIPIFHAPGIVEITDVSVTASQNYASSSSVTYSGTDIEFNLQFTRTSGNQYYVEYAITIENNSFNPYTINSNNFNATATTSGGRTPTVSSSYSGVEEGQVLAAGESITFHLRITLTNVRNGSATVTGESTTQVQEDESGNITVALSSEATGDLSNNNLIPFTAQIINTYGTVKTYSLKSSNTNFVVANADGSQFTTATVAAGETKNITFYLKKADGAIFTTESSSTNIILTCNESNYTVGTLTLSVPAEEGYEDTTPPTISNVTATQAKTQGSIDVTWQGSDDVEISNYTVQLYSYANGTETLISTNTTTNNYITITGAEDASYRIKVYATDSSGNTASEQDISNASSAAGVCSMTEVTCKWIYNITYQLTNASQSGSTTAILGTSYTTTISPTSAWGSLPDTITITTGSKTLVQNTDYTYDSSSGQIVINEITGDTTITAVATAGCLAEGTIIRLANGLEKKIEDVTYYDLLEVWDYETGKFINEYPIWIEKEKTTKEYQLTKFSDGTILKTIGYHGVFSLDLNMFISVDDPNTFKIGSKIAKIDTKGNIIPVYVTSIEDKYEEINYYHVVSTRYYNIIANNLLTTDGTVILSNLYGFKENITWPEHEKVEYEVNELNDVLPNYMIVGLRATEGKILQKYGLDLNSFKWYLSINQVNPDMLNPVPTKNGKRVWKVSTSDGHSKYVYDGEKYTLPITGTYWKNNTTGEILRGGSKVTIYTGTYFQKIK